MILELSTESFLSLHAFNHFCVILVDHISCFQSSKIYTDVSILPFFVFAIMSDVRCSCFSGKVLQKVLAVNDKNMDGTRLMNHSILCAEKWGEGKLCTPVEKNRLRGKNYASENDACIGQA